MTTPSSLKKALVLLSGGLDSTVNLLHAVKQYGEPNTHALSFDYGQKAAQSEINSAKQLVDYYKIKSHDIVELPWLGSLGQSALTETSNHVPELSFEDLNQKEKTEQTAKAVWVPNRNGVFIHIASSFAEARGIEDVIVGFNFEEAQTFPDNSEAYLQAENQALKYSTQGRVRIKCFTLHQTKKELLKEALRRDPSFPLHLIWSCYHSVPAAAPVACQKCESCLRFLRAKKECL